MKLQGLLLIGLTAIIIAVDAQEISTTELPKTIEANIDGPGEWMYPSLCSSDSSCLYKASWSLDPLQDVITFVIVAKQPNNTWIAIGIAPQRYMETVDVVFSYINSQGQGVIYDGWIGAYHTPPTVDAVQNLLSSSITNMDGYLTLKFSRYRQSTDQQNDYSFNNTDCYYFLFPVGGGPYNNDVGSISQHFDRPMISTEKICIRNTGSDVSSMSTSGSSGSSMSSAINSTAMTPTTGSSGV